MASDHLPIVETRTLVQRWRSEDEAAKIWYARVKSRPSFRPLLGETIPGIPPAACYADLDF